MTLTYSKRYFVVWKRNVSRQYLMNDALELARRMRKRGHTVSVHIGQGRKS